MTEPETTWPILTRFNAEEREALRTFWKAELPNLTEPEAVREVVKEYLKSVGLLKAEVTNGD